MFYIANLMNHLKAIQRCMDDMRGSAILNVKDLILLVRARGRMVHMQPQFPYVKDGRIRYTLQFEPHVSGFIGWRPYFNKRWELSTEKLKFKACAERCGIRTPPHWLCYVPGMPTVVVKQNRSSFGIGIRGPFARTEAHLLQHVLQADEYYEAYVPGRIAKAWYWNGTLCALELRPQPMVQGDGRRAIRDLAAAQCTGEVHVAALSWMAAYHGHTLDTVLRDGEEMPVDFKYGSPYDRPSRENDNVLSRYRGSPLERQFVAAGEAFLKGIPEAIRGNTVFTLDAIVNDAGEAWFLEMNSNPMVHPDVYPSMMESLFNVASSTSQPMATDSA
jgi:hypothetical protein